jgi:hypothetical protein
MTGLLLALVVGCLVAVVGINLGLGDRIASRPPAARRAWSYAAAGLASAALGLVIAVGVLTR